MVVICDVEMEQKGAGYNLVDCCTVMPSRIGERQHRRSCRVSLRSIPQALDDIGGDVELDAVCAVLALFVHPPAL